MTFFESELKNILGGGNIKGLREEEKANILLAMRGFKVIELDKIQTKNLLNFISKCDDSIVVEYIYHLLDNEYTYDHLAYMYDLPSNEENSKIEKFLFGNRKVRRCFRITKKKDDNRLKEELKTR